LSHRLFNLSFTGIIFTNLELGQPVSDLQRFNQSIKDVVSRCDLDLWLADLESGQSLCKIRATSNNAWL